MPGTPNEISNAAEYFAQMLRRANVNDAVLGAIDELVLALRRAAQPWPANQDDGLIGLALTAWSNYERYIYRNVPLSGREE